MKAGLIATVSVLIATAGLVVNAKRVVGATGTPVRPHPLKGVAAIVETDIISANYTYDDVLGPRVQFTLANTTVHAGTAQQLTTLSQFGGPLPDGTQVVASDLPVLTPGSRYILFLGSDPWFYTPVWTYLAFRVETVGAGRSS